MQVGHHKKQVVADEGETRRKKDAREDKPAGIKDDQRRHRRDECPQYQFFRLKVRQGRPDGDQARAEKIGDAENRAVNVGPGVDEKARAHEYLQQRDGLVASDESHKILLYISPRRARPGVPGWAA